MRWKDANDFPDKSGMYITEVHISEDYKTYRPVAYNSFDKILGRWTNVRSCAEDGTVTKWLDEQPSPPTRLREVIRELENELNLRYSSMHEWVKDVHLPKLKSLTDEPKSDEIKELKKQLKLAVDESNTLAGMVSEAWGEVVRIKKCTKPHCDCIFEAEKKAGGPVKDYPCLADHSEELRKLKSQPTDEPDAGYWKDVILKRIEYFASKWHKFESRELREALNVIERLVPPDQFQQLKQTPDGKNV